MALSARSRSWPLTAIMVVGLLLMFFGERMIAAGKERLVVSMLGLLLVLGALAVRFLRYQKADAERRRIEGSMLILGGLVLLALVLYALSSSVWFNLTGTALEAKLPRLSVILSALWPLTMAGALLGLLLAEMSYAAMARAERVEGARVADALWTGLGMAFTLAFAFAIVYVATERDKKWDFSYARTTKPSDATKSLAKSLPKKVQAHLYFPASSDVGREVKEYFSSLAEGAPNLEVLQKDVAIDTQAAVDHSLSDNGYIVLQESAAKDTIYVGGTMETARSKLRNLDKEVTQKLTPFTSTRRTAYFTTGHDEMNRTQKESDQGPIPTAAQFMEGMRSLNLDVRELSSIGGLASDVPADAAVVLILGPKKKFLAEEIASLRRYIENGGKAFIALEPMGEETLEALTKPLSNVRFDPTLLAHPQKFLAVTRQASDRVNIGTHDYVSHKSLTLLSRMRQNAPLLFMGAGSFVQDPSQQPAKMTWQALVKADPATFRDTNKDFTRQNEEPMEAFALAGILTVGEDNDSKGGRVVLLADSNAVSDYLLANQGNVMYVIDSVRWLLGIEGVQGMPTSEEDIRIAHTRKQDLAWFYSTIFLAPALVLGIGFVASRRRPRQSSTRKDATS